MPYANVLITITDFNSSVDIINLKEFELYKFEEVNITAGSIIITLDNDQKMRLLNLSPGDIDANNFIFNNAPSVSPSQFS